MGSEEEYMCVMIFYNAFYKNDGSLTFIFYDTFIKLHFEGHLCLMYLGRSTFWAPQVKRSCKGPMWGRYAQTRSAGWEGWEARKEGEEVQISSFYPSLSLSLFPTFPYIINVYIYIYMYLPWGLPPVKALFMYEETTMSRPKCFLCLFQTAACTKWGAKKNICV